MKVALSKSPWISIAIKGSCIGIAEGCLSVSAWPFKSVSSLAFFLEPSAASTLTNKIFRVRVKENDFDRCQAVGSRFCALNLPFEAQCVLIDAGSVYRVVTHDYIVRVVGIQLKSLFFRFVCLNLNVDVGPI